MNKQIVFLLTFAFHVFVTQHCIAMEEQSSRDFTIIDNDLYEKIINNKTTSQPMVFEATKGYFTTQGSFSCNNHKKVIEEAMRNGKAFYYKKNQSAIIYSNEETLTIEKVKHLKDWIETLINPNPKIAHSYSNRRKNDPHEIKPA